MATMLERCRIFKVSYMRDFEEKWESHEVFSLMTESHEAHPTKSYKVKEYFYSFKLEEIPTKPIIDRVTERCKELQSVKEQYPELTFNPNKVMTVITDENSILLDEFGVDFDSLTDEELKELKTDTVQYWISQTIIVHVGMRGQYVKGILIGNKVNHDLISVGYDEYSLVSKEEDSNIYKRLVNDYLFEKGVLDERYSI